MGLSVRQASWLREQNHDAVHLRDQGLQRLPDVDILSKARQEDRIVLTLDLDFGYLLAISGEELPGVVIFRMGNARSEHVRARLIDLLEHHADELQQGVIATINESSIRIRQLPISREASDV
jgi:predicted nuclease of predicted toxin-antitoxin system